MTALAAALVILANLGASPAQSADRGGDTSAPAIKTTASQSGDTLVPARLAPAAIPQPAPIVPEKKKKARLLGGFGLVICSVLALATGLALVHSLRQR